MSIVDSFGTSFFLGMVSGSFLRLDDFFVCDWF